jgi:hypothetical protein
MKKLWLFIALLAFTAVFAGSSQAQLPIEQRVDHFRCYIVPQSPTLNVNVQLIDQFDAAANEEEQITQLIIVRFCNPVQKTLPTGDVTPIVDIKHHLTLFLINPQPMVLRTVVIKNQFGQQVLTTADAKVLAVPTGKGLPPNPPPPPSTDLDHYKCYSASGNAVNATVLLKDQFLSENTTVQRPVLFCNPVKKIHGTVVVGIQNPDVHLTCYVTSASHFPGTSINIRNQFVALNNLALRQPDLLCVPSLKLAWAAATAADPAGAGTAPPQPTKVEPAAAGKP